MKKYYLFLFVLSIMLNSCEKEIHLQNPNLVHHINMEDINTILQLGFDTAEIKQTDTYYIVEEDIALVKDKLKEYFDNKVITKQAYSTYGLINPEKTLEIKVKISDSFSNSGLDKEWRDAINRAIQIWSSTESSIRITLVNTSDYDILIGKYYNTLSSKVIAHGEFPRNGKPGSMIEINYSFNKTLSSSEKTFTMVHEFGHNLGFRHTDWRTKEIIESPAYHINGTPEVDPNSVMNSTVADWKGFSNYDIIAIKKLYPRFWGFSNVERRDGNLYSLFYCSSNSRITFGLSFNKPSDSNAYVHFIIGGRGINLYEPVIRQELVIDMAKGFITRGDIFVYNPKGEPINARLEILKVDGLYSFNNIDLYVSLDY